MAARATAVASRTSTGVSLRRERWSQYIVTAASGVAVHRVANLRCDRRPEAWHGDRHGGAGDDAGKDWQCRPRGLALGLADHTRMNCTPCQRWSWPAVNARSRAVSRNVAVL